MKIKNRTKQKFTRLLSGILAFLMILSTPMFPVDAESTEVNPRQTTGVLNVDTSVGWTLGGTSYGTEGLMTIGGEVVYCMERLKTYYSGMSYTGSEDFSVLGINASMKEKLSLLAYFGAQRAKSTNNVDWYSVVGSAIWAETGQDRGWILSPTFDTDAKVKNAIQTLQNDVAKYYVKPSFVSTTATVKAGETIRLSDTNKVVGTYSIKNADGLDAKIEGNDLVITGTSDAKEVSSITLQKKISTSDVGVSILYSAGEDVQKVGSFKVERPIEGAVTVNVEKYGHLKIAKKDNKGNLVPNTQFKISYHADMSNPIGTYSTGNDGTVTIKNLNPVTVYVQEISVPKHLVLDGTIKNVSLSANQTVTFTATNNWKQGYIQVIKKDAENGKAILKAGTVFDVYNSSNTKVETITTNANGIATSKLLDYGTYYVKETNAPNGYILKVEVSDSVGIIENGKTYQITVSNKRTTGTITITKSDVETGNTVPNAVYGLYARENIVHPDGTTGVVHGKDALVATFPKTGTDGKATLNNLYLGKYYVKEITAPSGYVLSNETYQLDLIYAGQTVSVTDASATVTDKVQRGSVTLIKKDKELNYGSAVAGIVDSNKDGAQGDATIAGATYGLYAKEDILHKDTKTGVVSYNSNNGITLTKGTSLEVKNTKATAGALLATAKTDANGEIQFANLYLGEYYIKELAPSEGYLLDETEYPYSLTYEGQKVEVRADLRNTSLEQVKKQAFDLYKGGHVAGTSGNATPLEGVAFTVKLEADVQRLGWESAPAYDVITTNANGTGSSVELPYGTYRVRETNPVDGYATANDFFVTVKDDSRSHQSFTNNVIIDEAFTAFVKAVKVDKETGKTVKLAGAEFKIKALTDVTVDENKFSSGEYIGFYNWNILDGIYMDTWTTNEDGYILLGVRFGIGEYQLEEIHAPNGYTLDASPIPFKVTNNGMYEIAKDGKTPIITAYKENESVKGKIHVSKKGEVLVDFKDGKFVYEERGLAGAKYGVYAKDNIMDPSNDGTVIYAKDSLVTTLITGSDGKAVSGKLPLGKYYIKELNAPEGFVLSDKIADVELKYVDDKAEHSIVYDNAEFTNERQLVDISIVKKDAETETTLSGAEFILSAKADIVNYSGQVIVTKGTDIEKAVSGENGVAQFVSDLPIGLYEVRETKAPNGYASSDERMELNAGAVEQTKKVIKVTGDFKNHIITFEFSKVDLTTGKELPGATLEVSDKKGNIIDKWISTEDAHIIKGLTVGEEYTLTETIPADGYVTAESIQFTVQDTSEIQKVTMKDDFTKVEISKTDIVTGEPVVGAQLSIIPVKEDGTLDEGAVFDTWITSDEPHYIERLSIGTYVLRETLGQAYLYGYVTAQAVKFTVTDTPEIQKVEMKDDFTKVEISKVDEDGDFVEGATLQIVPLDENEKPLMGEAFETWLTGKEAHRMERLPIGKYMLLELSAPAGFHKAEPVVIEVKDNAEVQSFTMVDEHILTDIVFTKVDSKTGIAITGKDFSFTLYADADCKEKIATVNGDSKTGIAIFEDLRFGTYYVKETKAPSGYELSEQVVKVVLNENTKGIGDKYVMSFENTATPQIQTGDNNHMFFYGMLSILSLLGCAFVFGKKYHFI